MKEYEYKTQGYTLKSPGPATVEEYDEAAKKSGACLEDAIDNEIYRGTIPTFWRKALPKVAELTGIAVGVDAKATEAARARAKTPEAAAKTKDVPEKFSSYMGRVEAQFDGDKDKLAEIEALLKSIALETPIDPSPTSRARGPGKDYLEKADSWLGLPTDKLEEKISGAMGEIEGLPELDRDSNGVPTRDSLAVFIKAYVEGRLAQL